MKKNHLILFVLSLCILLQAGCTSQQPNEGIEKSAFYLDTLCTITVYSMENLDDLDTDVAKENVLTVIENAFALCEQYENLLSRTVEGSDIYRINHADGQAVEVNPETIAVIQKGIAYGDLSGGNFDITIGAVSELWNFHETDENQQRTGTVPDANTLSAAVSHVGYQNIEINGNTVRLTDPAAKIDLGGIAKGYIGDKVSDYLEQEGVTSALLALGGNIISIGEKGSSLTQPQGKAFSVGISDPSSQTGGLIGSVRATNQTIVTSGTYERYFDVDGVRYHHILNPATGYPFETDLASVTILAEKGRSADCDALSTLCLSFGSEKGRTFLQGIEGVEGIFVDTAGNITTSSEDIGFTAL